VRLMGSELGETGTTIDMVTPSIPARLGVLSLIDIADIGPSNNSDSNDFSYSTQKI
jgi:hypothetical protein